MNQEVPFLTAFITTSFSQSLHPPRPNPNHPPSPYLTDLFLTTQLQTLPQTPHSTLQLNNSIKLCIFKDKQKLPVSRISKQNHASAQKEQVSFKNADPKIDEPELFIERAVFMKDNKITDVFTADSHPFSQNQLQGRFISSRGIQYILERIEIYGCELIIKIEKGEQNADADSTRLLLTLQDESIAKYEHIQGDRQFYNLNTFCCPEGISLYSKQSGYKSSNFILTSNQQFSRIYCTSIKFRQKLTKSQQEQLQQKYSFKYNGSIYAQKFFIILSKYSCTEQATHYLQKIFFTYLNISQKQNGKTHFFEQIKKLDQLCTINQSTNEVKFSFDNFEKNFKINTSYPHTSTNAIYAVFKFLEVEKIIEIFEALLLEKNVFFISECNSIIGLVMEAFQSFLYPLVWAHVLLPKLTKTYLYFTQSPIPIIIGLSSELVPEIQNRQNSTFVYLDKNEVHEQIQSSPSKKRHSEQRAPQISPNLRKQLIEKLNQYSVYDKADVREYLKNTFNCSLFYTKSEQDPHFDVLKIRNIFLQFFLHILKDYKTYFLKPFDWSGGRSFKLREVFDMETFKKVHAHDDFLKKLFTTGLFETFIELRYKEHNSKWYKKVDKALLRLKAQQRKSIIKEQESESEEYHEENDEQLQEKGFDSNVISSAKKYSDLSTQENNKSLEATKPSDWLVNEEEQGNNQEKIYSKPCESNEVIYSTQQPATKPKNTIIVQGDSQTIEESKVCSLISYPYIAIKGIWARKQAHRYFSCMWIRKKKEEQVQVGAQKCEKEQGPKKEQLKCQ